MNHLKDHLGNVRAVFMTSYGPGASNLTQASNYYPFGMAFTVWRSATSKTEMHWKPCVLTHGK